MDNPESSTALFIAREILEFDCYRLASLELTPDSEVLDVGGNIGIFAIAIQKRFGCSVVSFEPAYESYSYAIFNQKLNNVPWQKIVFYNQAISKQGNTEISLQYIADAPGNSSKFEHRGQKQIVPATSLLPFIGAKTSMIKLDCEGEEFEILPEILPHIKHVPYLAVEAHPFAGKTESLRSLVEKEYPGKLIWINAN